MLCVNLLIVHQIAFTSYQVVDHQMNHNLMYIVHMKQNQLNTWQEYSANRLRWLFLWLTVTLKDWQEIGQGVLSFDKENNPCASCWCPSKSFIIIQSQKIILYKSLVNFTFVQQLTFIMTSTKKSNVHYHLIKTETKYKVHWITDPWKFELWYTCIFCMKKVCMEILMSYLRQSVSNSRSGLEITPSANSC